MKNVWLWIAAGVGLMVWAAASAMAVGSKAAVLAAIRPKYWGDVKVSGWKWGAATPDERKANVQTIIDVFTENGIPPAITLAAIVNAYAESGWNANAVGDGGHSIGLFQLNDWGAGKGIDKELRKDPRVNAQTIIDVELGKTHWAGKHVWEAFESGATVPQLAYQFCYWIERPKDKVGEATKRKHRAEQMFQAVPAATGVA